MNKRRNDLLRQYTSRRWIIEELQGDTDMGKKYLWYIIICWPLILFWGMSALVLFLHPNWLSNTLFVILFLMGCVAPKIWTDYLYYTKREDKILDYLGIDRTTL